ncbi:uncharacterized protein LOC122086510 isoform X3 [Macadamia integrifolia]|uniref:uncharacterized protein LOC122086510 isoform X3 n=1 Tax=Macadamia integrifolia TaxID=60698 RepID=UPI001C4EF07C|nr:uncharacterized protein LOC122086510 isoform X3 [Macadamia integrifolia]
MAVDLNFASLFQNLKLDDQWLPSKPWESIPFESGVSLSGSCNSTSSLEPLYDPSTVSEASLVRLVINALQGVQSAIDGIEKLSAAFCADPADRTSHRIPSLWHRSLSTKALGNILKSIGQSGFLVLLIRRFVDYFLCRNSNLDVKGREDDDMGRKNVGSESSESQIHYQDEAGVELRYSLVNQAFAVAVGKVLEGYICALDTLYASVDLRRSSKNVDLSQPDFSGVGCLTTVVHSRITLLEVYLHTKELRTHIEALGNICLLKKVDSDLSLSSLEDLIAGATAEFCNFHMAGNLLTYLYTQLRDADPVHLALLKFLFLCSCEPYCGFIKSWIYQARITDPYKEFFVECVENSPLYSHGNAGFCYDYSLAFVKEQAGVAIPCFLKDLCIPILRAGQQLQVLIKMLDLCNYMGSGDHNYEDVLPCWNRSPSENISYFSSLTFNKRRIEEIILTRENMYNMMREKQQNFFTGIDTKCQKVIPIFVDNVMGNLNFQVPCTSNDNLFSPSSTTDDGDSNLAGVTKDSDVSSTAESSCLVDPFESSSLDSFEEQTEMERLAELHGSFIGMEPGYFSASGSSTILPIVNLLQKPTQSENLHDLEISSHKTCGRMDSVNPFLSPCENEINSVHHQLEDSALAWMPEIQFADNQSAICWPLGGLSKNPFCVDENYRGESQHLNDSNLKLADRNMKVLKVGCPYFDEAFPNNKFVQEQATGRSQLENISDASSKSIVFPPWELKFNFNHLNLNPVLTKNAWFHTSNKSGYKSCMDKRGSFPYFDFSSVKDPCKAYGERYLATPEHEFQSALSYSREPNVAAGGTNEHLEELGHSREGVPVDQSKISHTYSSPSSKEKPHDVDLVAGVSGGAEWESSLNYSSKRIIHHTGGHRQSSTVTGETPLDVIIDKCMLQEIMLQYKYVSSFTIKLLEEGFDLQEHLLALRRYHFMELADWADLFIVSLWHHKWYAAKANEGISVIQGLLDLAVQRSSCERDHYKERLFVYMKGSGMMPISASSIGIHSFDFIGLGYRVDWPVSIVLTPDALKIYAQIFSFLIQIKLALFSLSDVWCLLKNLVHSVSENRKAGVGVQNLSYFNVLIKLRLQMNHFVSTLQQYVQSQLSHVSWCRFLDSLKHQGKESFMLQWNYDIFLSCCYLFLFVTGLRNLIQVQGLREFVFEKVYYYKIRNMHADNQVKDMLDLELVHMAYLADSLNICFLSGEKQPVASIIERILQCALDFRSCLTRDISGVASEHEDSQQLLARINYSQGIGITQISCEKKNAKHHFKGISKKQRAPPQQRRAQSLPTATNPC